MITAATESPSEAVESLTSKVTLLTNTVQNNIQSAYSGLLEWHEEREKQREFDAESELFDRMERGEFRQ